MTSRKQLCELALLVRCGYRLAVADRNDKLPLNVPGAFYVDGQCIDCDLCRQVAPGNFERSPEGGYSYVSKQPTGEEELRLCREALDDCPVEAIGEDGL